MSCRRHGTKPTVALWMLVAAADVALIVASVGMLAVVVGLALVAVLAVAVATARLLLRHGAAGSEPVLAPVVVRPGTRRRT